MCAWKMSRKLGSTKRSTLDQALSEALDHKSYLLLTSIFFVCSSQVAFNNRPFPSLYQ